MSIKYLQDQQLNQVQQSPNNSPWAKLVAQSEMLERNKMRQPQGQAPQGTVAGNIQQQLIDAQMKQERETQNADLYKSQMLAQLIGSGQIPANFAAQGYASGGLTQPGTGTYAGIMVPNQQPATSARMPTTYTPPNSQDPNAQEKKHGMLQSLLDNSIVGMAQGKANIGSAMQDYADLFSGKIFSRGFAEGGDIRGFAAGGESMAEQLARIKPQIEATLRDQGWTKEAIDRYVSAYKPEMGRGFTNQFPATTAQPPSLNDMLEMQRRKMAQTGLGVKDSNTIHIPPESGYPTGVSPKPYMQNAPQQTSAMETLAQSPEAQKRLTGPQGRVALPHIAQVSESPELQEYYKSLYGSKPDVTRGDILSQLGKANAPGEDQMRIPTREDMMRQAQGPSTGTDSLAEFKNRMYGADPSVVNPARSNLMGTLLNVAEQKEALANQPKPSMTEGMSAAAQSPPRIDTMASRMAAADKANDIKLGDPMAPGATTFEEMAAKAKQGLGSLGEAASAVGRPIAKIAGALSPIGDLAMANKFTGGSNALLAQALSGQTPSSTMQGDMPEVAKDLMAVPSLPDWAKNIGSAINSKVSGTQDSAQPDAWTGGATTPQTPPQTATAQTPSASPTQGTIYKANGVTRSKNSVTVTPDKKIDLDVMNNAHKQPDVPTNQVSEAAQKAAAAQQAISAIERRPNEEGQGSILDSLYSKLKDSDVDYSDLAKRISQNEYDLARERKDGTLNAILGGVGAALSKAGSYEGVGDRVFKPGLGAIAGAGIMGGLKMSAASDEAIDKKSQENMVAALALKKLKRESMNDVLDAISAQKQTDVYAQSVANTALSHRDTAANQRVENNIKQNQLLLNAEQIAQDAVYKQAMIDKARNELPAEKQGSADLLKAQLSQYTAAYTDLLKTPGIMPNDPRVIAASKKINSTNAMIDTLLQGFGNNVNLTPSTDTVGATSGGMTLLNVRNK